MASNRRIYRRHRPLRIFIRILIITIAALILISLMIFLGFQKYIVYTQDGVKLEIPLLQEDSDYNSDASPAPTADITVEVD